MNSCKSRSFAAMLMWSLVALQAADDDATTRLDITYKTTGQGPLRLDLHYPAAPKPDGGYPLVLFTHGGGWSAGNKTIGDRGVRFLGVSALTRQGFCVASVDYRLCTKDGKIVMRDCVVDAKDALRYLAKNARSLSLDAQHVFTWGDSAGGHLAQMLLLSPPDSFPGDPALADVKYRVIAGVSWYGPCDFEQTELFNGPGQTGVRDRFGARISKADADAQTKLAAYREVSPVNYLKPGSPPLLMVQGDKDPTIPVHHARYMKERADAVQAPVEILIVENSAHNWKETGGALRPSLDEIVAKTAAFLKEHLKRSGKQAGGIPYREALSEANVTLSAMKNGKLEGLIIGNGDLYGLVWDRDGELFLRMTKNDIWDARVDTSKDGPMPKVDIAAGRVTGTRGDTPSWKNLYPQPRCAIALRLGPVPQPFRGHLDLERAVVELGAQSVPEISLRVLYDRNVLLVKSPHPVKLEEIKAETLPPAELGTTDGVDWLRMKMPGDIDYKGMEYAVAVATRGELKAVSLVTSFDNPDADLLPLAISMAKKTVAATEAPLVARHEQAWHDFWARSGLRLEDPVLQRWWYRMLYFAGTICRPGTAPVGLMPPLAIDLTPWHADFHHNYNTWQCFLPLPGLNHPEKVDPWIGYNDRMIPRYKNLALETYGIEGVHLPISSFLHEPDPAVCKSVNKRQLSLLPWGLTIGLQGMTLQSMWQKYLHDQDVQYMERKIYPYLREAARFYVNFIKLCKPDAGGRIRLGPSYSPEHGAPGIYNCPFDIAYVHYTFDAMIEAGSWLKRDAALVESCRKFKSLLPDYPTAPDKDGNSIVVDWVGCKVGEIKTHNITVPASPVFPGEQVTWFDDEPTKELYRRTIQQIVFRDANAHVMLNIARARLSMPEAYSKARAWFDTRERPNGLFEWVGHGHAVFMPEMIGIAGMINEFMLQSVKNKIRLFPCWPKDKNAKFARLLAQGGFLVSAEFRNGKVVSAEVESTVGRQLQLLSPWKTIYANGTEIKVDQDGLVIMDTKAGQVLLFTEAEGKEK